MQRAIAAATSLLVVIAALPACSGQSAKVVPPSHRAAASCYTLHPQSPASRTIVEDRDIDKYIASDLPPDERAMMHKVMLTLHKTDRTHVMFFAENGRNYANSIALRNTMARAVRVAPDSAQYRLPNGHLLTMPVEDLKRPANLEPGDYSGALHLQGAGIPSPYPGTGAYRRVVAPPGYNEITGNVVVPCAVSYQADGEAGTVMFGGWGAGSGVGEAVDAGMSYYTPNGQFSVHPDYGSKDNLGVFILDNGQVDGTYQDASNNTVSGAPAHIWCDANAVDYMDFYISSPGMLVIAVSGVVEDGTQEDVTAVKDRTSAANAWPTDGGGPTSGVRLKRFTGLAQRQGFENTSDGAWFGVDPNNNWAPLIHWSQIQLYNSTGFYNWDSTIPARYETYPSCGAVRLNNTAGLDKSYDEYNGIADICT